MSHLPSPTRAALGLALILLVPLAVRGIASSGAQESERGPAGEARVRPETRLVPQRQWEYEQLPCLSPAMVAREGAHELAEQLNERGKRGWELVSLLEIQRPPGKECLLATLKRQRVN